MRHRATVLATLALLGCGESPKTEIERLQDGDLGPWLALRDIELYADGLVELPHGRAVGGVAEGELFAVLEPEHTSIMKRVRVEGGQEGWVDTRFAAVAPATPRDIAHRAMRRLLQRAAPGERWVLTGLCLVCSQPPTRLERWWELPKEQFDAWSRREAARVGGARIVRSGSFTVIETDGQAKRVRFDDGPEGWIDGTEDAVPEVALEGLFRVPK